MARPLSRKDWQGVAILGVAAAIVVTIAILTFSLRSKAGRYDPETLCPTDQDHGQVVVLVDKTDAFSPTQKNRLKRTIEQIRDGLARFEKLSIYVLDDKGVSDARFALCNPGSGKDANQFYENPAKIEEKFARTFGRPLDDLLDELLLASEAGRSPIMEAIRDIAILSDMRRSNGRRRLVIFSDLLQHTEGMSQYRKTPPFRDFMRQPYASSVLAPLNGVDVTVIYMKRAKYHGAQTMSHVHFWEQYFQESGATLIELDPIP